MPPRVKLPKVPPGEMFDIPMAEIGAAAKKKYRGIAVKIGNEIIEGGPAEHHSAIVRRLIKAGRGSEVDMRFTAGKVKFGFVDQKGRFHNQDTMRPRGVPRDFGVTSEDLREAGLLSIPLAAAAMSPSSADADATLGLPPGASKPPRSRGGGGTWSPSREQQNLAYQQAAAQRFQGQPGQIPTAQEEALGYEDPFALATLLYGGPAKAGGSLVGRAMEQAGRMVPGIVRGGMARGAAAAGTYTLLDQLTDALSGQETNPLAEVPAAALGGAALGPPAEGLGAYAGEAVGAAGRAVDEGARRLTSAPPLLMAGMEAAPVASSVGEAAPVVSRNAAELSETTLPKPRPFRKRNAASIASQIESQGGATIKLPEGTSPETGAIFGEFPNADPRVLVQPGPLTGRDVGRYVRRNQRLLMDPDKPRHLGGWIGGPPENPQQRFLEISRVLPFPEIPAGLPPAEVRALLGLREKSIRQGTMRAEDIGQLEGYLKNPDPYWRGFGTPNPNQIPIGSLKQFLAEQYPERLRSLMPEARAFGQQHGSWWANDPWVEIYGEENLPQVAGFNAATSNLSPPSFSSRFGSEYMRRHLAGEPIIQPDWRAPDPWDAEFAWMTPGKQMPLEAGRTHNLLAAARGDIDALRALKVRSMGQGFMHGASAAPMRPGQTHPMDLWESRLAEDPMRGVFTGPKPGTFTPRRERMVAESQRDILSGMGEHPLHMGADIWSVAREMAKRGEPLFGQNFSLSRADTGPSFAQSTITRRQAEQKAHMLGMDFAKFKDFLRKKPEDPNANLLGIAATLGLAGMAPRENKKGGPSY